MNMKRVIYTILILLILFSCREKREKRLYSEYFDMDITIPVEEVIVPKQKTKVPFVNNKIYDPFARKTKSVWYEKSTFETPTKVILPKLIVLDDQTTTLNVSKRKAKKKITKGFPLIIENKEKKDTLLIPLFRGTLPLVQEALNEKHRWVEIEHLTKEKMGYFHYKIFPHEYIYTKIPIYKGDIKTKLRVKLQLNDSTTVYSNTYNGFVNKKIMK